MKTALALIRETAFGLLLALASLSIAGLIFVAILVMR